MARSKIFQWIFKIWLVVLVSFFLVYIYLYALILREDQKIKTKYQKILKSSAASSEGTPEASTQTDKALLKNPITSHSNVEFNENQEEVSKKKFLYIQYSFISEKANKSSEFSCVPRFCSCTATKVVSKVNPCSENHLNIPVESIVTRVFLKEKAAFIEELNSQDGTFTDQISGRKILTFKGSLMEILPTQWRRLLIWILKSKENFFDYIEFAQPQRKSSANSSLDDQTILSRFAIDYQKSSIFQIIDYSMINEKSAELIKLLHNKDVREPIKLFFIFGKDLVPKNFNLHREIFGEPKIFFAEDEMGFLWENGVIIDWTTLDFVSAGIRRRSAVIASSDTPKYAFYAPIAALFWKRIVGMETIFLAVGPLWEADLALMKIKEHLIEQNVKIIPICSNISQIVLEFSNANSNNSESRVEIPLSTVAQVSRLLASRFLSLRSEDTLLTSDVEIIPLKASYFLSGFWQKADVHMMNTDCCGPLKSIVDDQVEHIHQFPVSYVSGNFRFWSTLLQSLMNRMNAKEVQDPCDLIIEVLKTYLSNELERKILLKEIGIWTFDQYILSHLLRTEFGKRENPVKQGIYTKNKMRFLDSPYIDCRIDRECWHTDDADISIDAHLLREGFFDKIWNSLQALFSLVLPQSDIEYLENYRNAMKKLLMQMN